MVWVRNPLGGPEYLGVTGYWGPYIYCGQDNFTLWGPEEHHAYRSHPHGRWACGAQLWGLWGRSAYGILEH